ncbi:MAG: hypothetical protein ACREX4_25160 [Gammaproteobacteria bacterium]
MRRAILSMAFLPQQGTDTVDSVLDELTAVERSALDRWVTGDPDGYLNIFAPEVTYLTRTRKGARMDWTP